MEMLLNMNPSETFNCSAVSYIKQNTIGNHELLKCHIIHPEVELRVFFRGPWTILLTWTTVPSDVPSCCIVLIDNFKTLMCVDVYWFHKSYNSKMKTFTKWMIYNIWFASCSDISYGSIHWQLAFTGTPKLVKLWKLHLKIVGSNQYKVVVQL